LGSGWAVMNHQINQEVQNWSQKKSS